jgi:hypothetical protein
MSLAGSGGNLKSAAHNKSPRDDTNLSRDVSGLTRIHKTISQNFPHVRGIIFCIVHSAAGLLLDAGPGS